ncbi:LPXTG cell wall anchor domain-containing protein [Winkia neuii]|nr:LPXTG cell wall anchor domain-containing protein [Winkia neuii]MDK8100005.1 LPXTG cell wall anchor domain-containing protein [Winkia neuii]
MRADKAHADAVAELKVAEKAFQVASTALGAAKAQSASAQSVHQEAARAEAAAKAELPKTNAALKAAQLKKAEAHKVLQEAKVRVETLPAAGDVTKLSQQAAKFKEELKSSEAACSKVEKDLKEAKAKLAEAEQELAKLKLARDLENPASGSKNPEKSAPSSNKHVKQVRKVGNVSKHRTDTKLAHTGSGATAVALAGFSAATGAAALATRRRKRR